MLHHIIFIFVIISCLGLLLFLFFITPARLNDQSNSKNKSKNNQIHSSRLLFRVKRDNTNSIPKNQRNVKNECSSKSYPYDKQFFGHEILSTLSDSSNKKNLIQKFPTYSILGRVKASDISQNNQFIRFYNNYPAMSFSINVPSRNCLRDSILKLFLEKFDQHIIFEEAESDIYVIKNMSPKNLPEFIFLLSSLIKVLLELDPAFSIVHPTLRSDTQKCQLITRCSVQIAYSQKLKYFITIKFSPLSDPGTTKLSPRPEPFVTRYNSKFTVPQSDFNAYESDFNNLYKAFNQHIEKSFFTGEALKYNTLKNCLRTRIVNETISLAFRLAKLHSSDISISKISTPRITKPPKVHDDSSSFFMRMPYRHQKEHVEFLLFAMQSIEITDIDSKNISIVSKSLGTSIVFLSENELLFMSKDINTKDGNIGEFNVPTVGRASIQYFEKLFKPNDAHLKNEVRLREGILKAIREMYYLAKRVAYFEE